ncbi:MAG: type II toxin-antitoxin system HicA family toxin [Armatimonadota bacterium]|nr:type II toxin-antitoxin system HicA family toxin [Armatimonadota bacterium]
MSPKLKRMSGAEAIEIFRKLGFEIAGQRGNHVKLVRIGRDGERKILTIPTHKELDAGTLHAIVRQAGRFVEPQVLGQRFYTP